MKKQVLLQPAYVLHQRAYRDSSAIVELFTPEHGRVGVVAKGIKRPKSPWRGLLQPFQPLLVSWLGGGELKTLTGVEVQGMPLQLPSSSLASGFYLNELLMRLLARLDPQLILFGCYDASLRRLATVDSSASLELLLRYFECDFLETLGYGLVLDADVVNGRPLQVEQLYDYQAERGPVPLCDDEPLGVVLHGATLLGIRDRALCDEQQRREAKRLMRAVLARYLGTKPLFSRQLLPRSSQGTLSDALPARTKTP